MLDNLEYFIDQYMYYKKYSFYSRYFEAKYYIKKAKEQIDGVDLGERKGNATFTYNANSYSPAEDIQSATEWCWAAATKTFLRSYLNNMKITDDMKKTFKAIINYCKARDLNWTSKSCDYSYNIGDAKNGYRKYARKDDTSKSACGYNAENGVYFPDLLQFYIVIKYKGNGTIAQVSKQTGTIIDGVKFIKNITGKTGKNVGHPLDQDFVSEKYVNKEIRKAFKEYKQKLNPNKVIEEIDTEVCRNNFQNNGMTIIGCHIFRINSTEYTLNIKSIDDMDKLAGHMYTVFDTAPNESNEIELYDSMRGLSTFYTTEKLYDKGFYCDVFEKDYVRLGSYLKMP